MSLQLLLNVSFLILPILLFQFIHELGIPYKYKTITIIILSSISAAVCMAFPFVYASGYNSNLMLVPFTIAILYGGWRAGLFLSILAAIVRYGLSQQHLIFTLIVCLVAWLVITAFRRLFHKSGLKVKIGITLGLMQMIVAFIFGAYALNRMYGTLEGFIVLSALHLAAAGVIVFIIESYHDKVMIRKEWEKYEKVQVASQLAASIAHEVRNPLTTVKGALQLLKERKTGQDRMDAILDAALEDVEHAESIISNFVFITKPDDDVSQPINMKECMQSAVELISSYALMSNVEIKFSADESMMIYANKSKFLQCLINLMMNAVEAMPDGGTLTVAGRIVKDRQIIDIVDTGIGMSAQQLAKLGVPYYSTKAKGTGLGLLFCYQYISSINGTLHVESSVGNGTRFSIILPNRFDVPA